MYREELFDWIKCIVVVALGVAIGGTAAIFAGITLWFFFMV